MSRSVLRTLSALALLGVALSGCVTQRVQSTPSSGDAGGELAGMAPMLSVERFLQAANARDYEAMTRLFGTHDGPVEGNEQELEVRMATIAQILRHDDYEIVSEEPAAGREHPTNRIGVTLVQGGQRVRDVPFMVVRTESGSWLVQEIGLERITGA